MKSGIHSQITEHLERLGSAFGTLRNRLVEEKENTKALITDISHQLKTPIAALGLSFELVKDEDITAAEKDGIPGACRAGSGEIKLSSGDAFEPVKAGGRHDKT